MRRPRRSAEHTGVGKSTYKPTRSSLTIRMTSDRLASPKMEEVYSILQLTIFMANYLASLAGWKKFGGGVVLRGKAEGIIMIVAVLPVLL
jgi:hypothetical protein